MGFQHRDDAERFLVELRRRLTEFGLELAEEKTRLIEFGRFAARDRERRGDPKPDTFTFLGLTHICAESQQGWFKLKRVTSKKKMRAKLRSVKTEMRARRHLPIPEQGVWLASVLDGHYRYYAVPDNGPALRAYRQEDQTALARLPQEPQPASPSVPGADEWAGSSMATRTPDLASLA